MADKYDEQHVRQWIDPPKVTKKLHAAEELLDDEDIRIAIYGIKDGRLATEQEEDDALKRLRAKHGGWDVSKEET